MADDKRPLWADPRALLLTALLGGTGIGGGSVQILKNEEADRLEALAVQVERLSGKVDKALEWQTRSDSRISEFWLRTFPRLESQVSDHEERIRELEKRRR